MSDSTTPENCSNCRFHTRQKREQPLWFEAGEQMRTLDEEKDIFVCQNKQSPHVQKELQEPVRCEVYEQGVKGAVSLELSERMEKALNRLKTAPDHPRED